MSTAPPTALDRARSKAYRRLLPLLFLCYVIAYVDRNNVAIAKLDDDATTCRRSTTTCIGIGSGIFFIGYFLLEIPGTLLVEKWSARKWISRIMISWGIVAALTAFVKIPWQFYTRPVLPGPGRGRVLPRRDRLPDALVPQPRPRAGPVLVPHRHADRAVRQPEALVPVAQDRHDETVNGQWSITPSSWAWRAGSGSTSPGASRRWSWASSC